MLTHKRGGEHPASDWGLLREAFDVTGLNPHVGAMADPSDNSQQGSSSGDGRPEDQAFRMHRLQAEEKARKESAAKQRLGGHLHYLHILVVQGT